MTPLDASFLRVETRNAHMHVAWSGTFAPPLDCPRPTLGAFRAALAGRLHLVPRFRQRVSRPPPGFGEPFWVDDPEFDIAGHVTLLTEPDEAVTRASFADLTDALLSEPLDRRRPLWHFYLVPRLEDDRVGLICKMHHALVDGLSVVELGSLLFDLTSDADPPPPAAWRPAPRPSRVQLALAAAADNARLSVRTAARAGALAVQPARAVASVARTLDSMTAAVEQDLLPPAPPSRVNVPIGPNRTLVRHEEPLEPLLEIKRRAGVTLNDVGLTVVAGALRELALPTGDAEAPLKAMVPVNRRGEDEGLELGNRISFAFIALPVHLDSPRARLRIVHRETAEFKRSDRPAGTGALLDVLGLLPGPLKDRIAQILGSARVFNLTVSNIPGPRAPVFLLGAELEEAYPVVPVAEDHALSIGMFSYRDRMFFGCYADPAALPEVDELPAALHDSLAALSAAYAPPRRGGREARPALRLA